MKKHIQNLQRLCQKMQVRYGEDDDLVLQLKLELASLEAKKAKNRDATKHNRRQQDTDPSTTHLH
jgi:peptidoglycan hydrolase CwlO-like protein